MKKAIILSSGGVDSTTCVSLAVDRLGAENVVTAFYSLPFVYPLSRNLLLKFVANFQNAFKLGSV